MSDPWREYLRTTMAGDPEFAAYIRRLDPNTSLKQAVDDYIVMLQARVEANQRELSDAEEVLAVMRTHGFTDTEQLLEAVERGDVHPTERMVESLVRSGVLTPVPEQELED
jgi:hypothetical protein